MRLLLVNPRQPESFWSFRWALDQILSGKRALNPPLGLATLAALCPAHWSVEIVDENIESVPLVPQADIVGVGGMGVQAQRQKELLRFYRARGYYVVAGGSYASLCPDFYADVADTVICGEAERIWRNFCADFERGQAQPLYVERDGVDLDDSPVPRFDLLKLSAYSTVTLQFSRGCPYRCEFCDIIVMYGRKPRWKAPEQVGRELDELRRCGVRSVFFVDDNFIGNPRAARGLLNYLIDYQKRERYRFIFGTEVSINVAQDAQLLALLRSANFGWVFIGIESPDAESLKEAGKTQNLRQDALASVRQIYASGIDVLAGFIVGFDNDTLHTFERQYRFIVESGIQAAMVGLLAALPRTPLHARLQREGRLLPIDGTNNSRAGTNFVPKRMDYGLMVEAYKDLHRRLTADAQIARRILNKTRHMGCPASAPQYHVSEAATIIGRLLLRGVLPGGPVRLLHFLRSLPVARPRLLRQALVDWIAGIAMRDYTLRHFPAPLMPAAGTSADELFRSLQHAISEHLATGRVMLALKEAPTEVPQLSISLGGWLGPAFFRRTARHLRRFLRRTPTTLNLQITQLRAEEIASLQRMLRRLAAYGDRIFIRVDEALRGRITVDSSVFHVILDAKRL